MAHYQHPPSRAGTSTRPLEPAISLRSLLRDFVSWLRRLACLASIRPQLFCDSLRSSRHLPNCMNPADRFTPELRRLFSDIKIPKHVRLLALELAPFASAVLLIC